MITKSPCCPSKRSLVVYLFVMLSRTPLLG